MKKPPDPGGFFAPHLFDAIVSLAMTLYYLRLAMGGAHCVYHISPSVFIQWKRERDAI